MKATQVERVLVEMTPAEADALSRAIRRTLQTGHVFVAPLDARRLEALEDVLKAAVEKRTTVREIDT